MNKRKILNDPVYGFINIPTDLIYDLIEHRYFQRLRRIKQVGLTHYVYPGALHTRFQHALGAMHLMGGAIHTLRMKGNEISAEDEEAARIAILLHDIGHGPYSHALEHLLLPLPHEEITLKFMHLLNAEFDGQLTQAIRIFEGTHPRKFLNQLVSGQLDMDRLDYLRRDSFFSGVAEGVIGHDRIIAMLNLVDDHIVVEEKGLFSIEKFLVARRLMYLQVYLHKAVISAEQMLRQLIGIVRTDYGSGDVEAIPVSIRKLFEQSIEDGYSEQTLEMFAAADDVDVDYMLKGLMNSKTKTLKMLASGLVHRKLFRTQFSPERISPDQVTQMIQQVSENFAISTSEATSLVVSGAEKVPTYDPSQGEIRFLRKDGTVVALPELLDMHVSMQTHYRYYLCFPER